jgi:hypothetical protein
MADDYFIAYAPGIIKYIAVPIRETYFIASILYLFNVCLTLQFVAIHFLWCHWFLKIKAKAG